MEQLLWAFHNRDFIKGAERALAAFMSDTSCRRHASGKDAEHMPEYNPRMPALPVKYVLCFTVGQVHAHLQAAPALQ